MDMDNIRKDIESIGIPKKRKPRQADTGIKNGQVKALLMRLLAIILLILVIGFGLLVTVHYKSPIMTLIVLIYLALGGYLAYKLLMLTYVGWLYTLFLSIMGILLPVLALISRGTSNATLTMGALVVIIISIMSVAALWWVKDLFGIKRFNEIFTPYR